MDFSDYYRPKGEEALCLAADLFRAQDYCWSLPLVFCLSNHEVTDLDATHAVVWDERCLHRMLPLANSPNREKLLADVEILCAMRARRASSEEIGNRALEIWYRPLRDHAQTAVSQLYGAVARQLHPDGKRPITEAGVGVFVLTRGEGFPEEFLAIALEEFKYVHDQRRSGILPAQLLDLVSSDDYGFRLPQ